MVVNPPVAAVAPTRRVKSLGLDPSRLVELRRAALDSKAISTGSRMAASVHEFYRYPGRLPPTLARAIIQAFTGTGDLVVDPFSGGGTCVVEAQRLGRPSIAADINPLATFVTTAKTRLYSEQSIRAARHFARAIPAMRVSPADPNDGWARDGYWRNISSRDTWRIRNLLLAGLRRINELENPEAQLLVRCALLRTGQWALDMRQTIPSVSEFRSRLAEAIDSMATAASSHRSHVMSVCDQPNEPSIVNFGLPDSVDGIRGAAGRQPALIVTSPPYPGVYVNYHRWKVRGRKETPAPYWLANQIDGYGISRYTMSARNGDSSRTYFQKLRDAYGGLVKLMTDETWLVQIVGFHDVKSQLNQYLSIMSDLGLYELNAAELATASDGRLWRNIPGRRWWAVAGSRAATADSTAREVVLFHRKLQPA